MFLESPGSITMEVHDVPAQSEQAVLSLLECGVDQYMAFPLSLQRLRGKVSNELNRLL